MWDREVLDYYYFYYYCYYDLGDDRACIDIGAVFIFMQCVLGRASLVVPIPPQPPSNNQSVSGFFSRSMQ